MSRKSIANNVARWFIAKEFDTEKQLSQYLKDHPAADKSKHTVTKGKTPAAKPEDAKPKKGEKPADKSGVKVDKEVAELFERELPNYKLKLLAGKDGVLDKASIENAKDIKAKLKWLSDRVEKGIKEAADICEMKPPVCQENMGITRDHMPQIMDKSVKDLLASKKEGDRKKGQAAVDAGANPDEDRSVMTVLMDDLKSEGVKISDEKVPVGNLRATQQEIKADKTYGMANAYLEGNEGLLKAMGNPIIISSDNHILDGHHRYSAMLTADPSYEMNVVRVDMPMKEFLTRSHEQPGVFRADINDNVIDDSNPIDLGEGPKKIKRKSKKAAIADRVARWMISREDGISQEDMEKILNGDVGSID